MPLDPRNAHDLPLPELPQAGPPSSEGRPRNARYCRTHAMVADLFAKSSPQALNTAAWTFNATAWAELAELKERSLADRWDRKNLG